MLLSFAAPPTYISLSLFLGRLYAPSVVIKSFRLINRAPFIAPIPARPLVPGREVLRSMLATCERL